MRELTLNETNDVNGGIQLLIQMAVNYLYVKDYTDHCAHHSVGQAED